MDMADCQGIGREKERAGCDNSQVVKMGKAREKFQLIPVVMGALGDPQFHFTKYTCTMWN